MLQNAVLQMKHLVCSPNCEDGRACCGSVPIRVIDCWHSLIEEGMVTGPSLRFQLFFPAICMQCFLNFRWPESVEILGYIGQGRLNQEGVPSM